MEIALKALNEKRTKNFSAVKSPYSNAMKTKKPPKKLLNIRQYRFLF